MRPSKLSGGNFSVVLAILIIFSLSSCSRKISFARSTVVPAAEGQVKIKKDNNKNYSIDLNVMRLAEPKRLSPPKDTYVAWMETEQNGTKNIGRLTTSSGLFSSTLKSSLSTTTPYKPTAFFITAEDDSNVQYPGGQVVLRTNSF
ncbi:MAG: hypothetical protein ACR2KZ_18765 [Segetibacter sp.]